MCGIVGWIASPGVRAADWAGVLDSAVQSLRHRGPNTSGTWLHENVGLGFARLAIQDLSCQGRQPMLSDDGSIVLFEWDVDGESKAIDYDSFSLTLEMADSFKKDLVIMHPLPRRHELDERLDTLPQAHYWNQVRNGMWMRAALIASIFNVDTSIRDHYQAYYAY